MFKPRNQGYKTPRVCSKCKQMYLAIHTAKVFMCGMCIIKALRGIPDDEKTEPKKAE